MPVRILLKRAGKAAFAIFAAAALLALSAAVASIFVEIVPAVRIRDGLSGKTLAVIPARDGMFVHHYMHTINLRPVDECFRLEGRSLHLFEVRYDTMSVGMTSDAELGYRLENGRFYVRMDRIFAKIPLRVSVKPEHGIIAGGTYYPFTNWAKPMKALVLEGANILVRKAKEAPQ